MVMVRNLVKVGSREVKKRYIGNKLIFEDLGDKTELLSGQVIFTDQADDSVVHVEIDGKSVQEGEPSPYYPVEFHSLNDFDVVSSTEKLSEGQLEEYDCGAEYGDIDKINLLLSEPLRSVGDVKDRLFRDSDGLWKIERKVGEEVFENGDKWQNSYWYESDNSALYGTHPDNTPNMKQNGAVCFSHVTVTNLVNTSDINTGSLLTNPRLRLRLRHEVIGATEPSLSLFEEWLINENEKGTPLTVVYEKAEFTIEILDQELQGKLNNLRSFQDSNYIYTIINDKTDNLKPTLHTTFKSKGWYDYYKKTLLK